MKKDAPSFCPAWKNGNGTRKQSIDSNFQDLVAVVVLAI